MAINHKNANILKISVSALTILSATAYSTAQQTNDYGQPTPTPMTSGSNYIDWNTYPDGVYSENFLTPYFNGAGIQQSPWSQYDRNAIP